MKKPILATVGVAGACALCCAIPVALPLISGLSVAGLVGFDWQQPTMSMSREVLAVAAGAIVAVVASLAMWTARRRRAASACVPPGGGAAAQQSQPKAACGCTGPAKSTPVGSSL